MSFKTGYIQIDGSINIDGSIFQFGVPFVGGGGPGGDLGVYVKSASIGVGSFFNTGSKTFDSSVNLDMLTDVAIAGPSDNQILAYDLATGRWLNQSTVDISTLTVDASLYFQQLLVRNSPLSNGAGNPGQWCYDSSYLYICTSTNTWMRILGVSGY